MIARKFAIEQIARMENLRGYPDTLPGLETLVDMLETAPSPAAARTFVTCWIQDEPKAPTPTHIYRYFHPTKAGATVAPLATSKNCPFCNGSGWQVVQNADNTSAAKPCRCRKAAVVKDE